MPGQGLTERPRLNCFAYSDTNNGRARSITSKRFCHELFPVERDQKRGEYKISNETIKKPSDMIPDGFYNTYRKSQQRSTSRMAERALS